MMLWRQISKVYTVVFTLMMLSVMIHKPIITTAVVLVLMILEQFAAILMLLIPGRRFLASFKYCHNIRKINLRPL